jgi:hypothetical protein
MPGEGLTHGPRATKSTRQNHRLSRSSGIPCAAVLTLIRDLPGVPGLLAVEPQEVVLGQTESADRRL